MAAHEPLQVHRAAKTGSDRSFGLVFAAVFLLVALSPLVHHQAPRWWAIGVALVFLALAWLAPHRLAALNGLWFRLGRALHAVVGPLILRVLYFAILVPYAQVLRWRGHDPLRLKRSDAATYWIERDPAGPAAGAMTKQF